MTKTRLKPGAPRATITDTFDGLCVAIPAPRSWFGVVAVAFWPCAWGFGEIRVMTILLGGGAKQASLFLVGWLGMWTFAGARAIFAWLWNLGGREIVAVDGRSFRIKRQLWGIVLPRAKEYELGQMRNLRAPSEPNESLWWSSSSRFWTTSGGTIAFDYGAQTYRFGAGLDEAEPSSSWTRSSGATQARWLTRKPCGTLGRGEHE